LLPVGGLHDAFGWGKLFGVFSVMVLFCMRDLQIHWIIIALTTILMGYIMAIIPDNWIGIRSKKETTTTE